MDVREKFVELLCEAQHIVTNTNKAEYLVEHGVTVQNIPSTDVGEWIKNGWNDYSCSVCGCQLIGHGASNWNYCPNCGAKMMPQPPKGE